MIRFTRNASELMRSARRWATAGSRSNCRVSASRPRAPMGVLSSCETLAMKSRRMSSSRRRSETSSITASTPRGRRPSSITDGADGQGAPRRPVDVDGPLGDAVEPALGQDVGDRLGGDGVAVAAGHERLGLGVAEEHAAGLVAQHQAEGQGVHRAAQADRLGAGLADGGRGGAGDLLEVARAPSRPGRCRWRGSTPRREPERRQALGDRAVPAPAVDEHADHRRRRRGRPRPAR